MKKLGLLSISAVMIAALPVSIASAGSLTFTTGRDKSTYYEFGSVLGEQVSDTTDTTVTAITSEGSQANMEALAHGDAELALVQSDVMAYAYEDSNIFDSDTVENFSTVANVYTEPVQIVTCNSDIKTIEDLKGKHVSIGAPGSAVYFNAMDILGVYGLTEEDITPAYDSFRDSVDSLQNGEIDAAFITTEAPTTAVASLGASRDIHLIGLDEDRIEALIEASPYYSKDTIAADVYGLDEDISTIAVGAIVIARNDVADEDVYNFVSAVFENADTITGAHTRGAQLELELAASVTAVPYHPGAATYFEEKGLTVATE